MSLKTVQLDLFVKEKELQEVLQQEQFKKNVSKSIRGLFARYNEIEYIVLDMHRKIDRLSEEKFKNA